MAVQPEGETYRRGMVVVAHPDDAEFGCSATVAKWCRESMEVVYVIVTDGSKGTPDRETTPEQLARMRKHEQMDAAKILGLKGVAFLGYPDAYLQPTLELRKDIVREIRRFRHDVLITTSPVRTLTGTNYLGHPDHFAAGEATLSAVYPAARDHLTFPELLQEGLEPHKVREVWIIGHDHPDHWVDVTETLDTAIRALKAHVSQIRDPEVDVRMRAWRTEAGAEHGVKYAETFKRFVMR